MTPYIRIPALALALAGVAASLPSMAEEDHHQKAHVHGEAQLQIALEGNTAELILRSPAANLLGFEHQPKSAEQEKILTEAQEWLAATPLVQTMSNDCTVAAGSIHYERDHSGEDDHGHDNHNDSHSDFEVTQRLECENNLADSLTVPLMERFPGITHLSVEWLSASGQGHTEMHAGEEELKLAH